MPEISRVCRQSQANLPLSAVIVFLLVSGTGLGQSDVPVTALSISPDGNTLISGGQNGINDASFATRMPQIHDLAFSPNGKWLAAAGGDPAESGGVELFPGNGGSSRALRYPELADDVIYSAAWSPDGSMLALASLDGSCALIRPGDGQIVRRIRGHSRGVMAAQFLSNEVLVTASLDHTIRVWRVENGELQRTLKNHTGPVSGLAVRPATNVGPPMLASVSHDRTVRLWQPTIGRMVRFVRLDSRPQSVAWYRDGTRLVVACRDGDVRIINPDTVEIEHRLPAIKSHAWCLVVTPDGRQIIVAGGGGEVVRLPVPRPAQ
jgi:WD40 repeat protein